MRINTIKTTMPHESWFPRYSRPSYFCRVSEARRISRQSRRLFVFESRSSSPSLSSHSRRRRRRRRRISLCTHLLVNQLVEIHTQKGDIHPNGVPRARGDVLFGRVDKITKIRQSFRAIHARIVPNRRTKRDRIVTKRVPPSIPIRPSSIVVPLPRRLPPRRSLPRRR